MNYMTNKIVAIQGDIPSKLNPETDTSIFLANEIQKKNYRIFEVGISYYGRTYKEGKKIGWKDGFRAIYCILKYNKFILL